MKNVHKRRSLPAVQLLSSLLVISYDKCNRMFTLSVCKDGNNGSLVVMETIKKRIETSIISAEFI